MAMRQINPKSISKDEDFVGNNAAFTCPKCGKVFIVSGLLHKKSGRACPGCGQSTAYVSGGQKKDGQAHIEWN